MIAECADINAWRWKNFQPREFACTHCGVIEMTVRTLDRLQLLRTRYGRPLRLNSGYRCTKHALEKIKPRPGAHAYGMAVDVQAGRPAQRILLPLAREVGFTGIGVAERYLHLDDVQPGEIPDIHRPAEWRYK